MTEPVKVLVIDDHRMFSEALVFLLAGEERMEVVGSAATGEEALDLCRHGCPDVVLMDIGLPGMDGIETCRRVREGCPDTRVVAMTGLQDHELVARAIEAGSCGFVPKTEAPDRLVSVIRQAAGGEMVLPSSGVAAVFERLSRERQLRVGSKLALSKLTPRELEVLQAFAEGLSTAKVASRLYIQPRTVRSHVDSVLFKLGVHSKLEAVLLALQEGFVTLSAASR